MSLPSPWVDRIFDKLTLTYGQAFLRRWQDLDIQAVKEDWAHELSGFQQSPQAITYALQNLPVEKPPTVLEFRAICRSRPPEVFVALPAVKLDADRLEAHVATARRRMPKHAPGNKDWAHRIINRHAAGDRVLPYTLHCAQQALGIKPEERQAA